MIDPEIASSLLGPLGGAVGFGMVLGGTMMFAANRKVVEPYVQRAHNAEIAGMQAEIEVLKLQVKELTQFKEQYLALLERHSKATLNP